ncbi:hypothetical protein DEA8626_00903 [Defluviimonas aquaemixtae]|uniref:DUF2189 domain-containing protein n=1 Tax=Albidovulum aquaemixtae TaxID=1542388 RepID=A0A2R8B475_9RHOB|nr:DUF2189 domain-containing protein [Defluviimonas aquaemixtae]SPH17385.1 hypothetical protein DEA8626_00903 [Defluviimonas aquaemixtae]
MTNTIGNPLSWGMRMLGIAGHDVSEVARELGGTDRSEPVVRHITTDDIRTALRLGVQDFMALRTDVIVACLLYPIIGACLVWAAFHRNLLPLLFPLISGFALIGPAAAVGLYEMSRRREAGKKASWADGFAILQSPRFGAIFILAVAHFFVFFVWILVAYGIFLITMGPEVPTSAQTFFSEALTTGSGWAMILIGFPVGFLFALLVLATSIVSFPLLIDRHVGLPVAVVTSLRVARTNPGPVALWGITVAVLLALGALPFLLGLAVVMPILGHATWHLYRRAVAPV